MKLYLSIAGIISILVAAIAGPGCVAMCNRFHQIGELSATLFAVIGVWLALSYRDDIITNMWRGDADEQKKSARLVKVAYERCELLFRGFVISTMAFVFSFIISMILPLCAEWARGWTFAYADWVRVSLQYVLMWCCSFLCFMQLYALFVCISPMKSVVNELKSAKDNADRIIANAKAAGEAD